MSEDVFKALRAVRAQVSLLPHRGLEGTVVALGSVLGIIDDRLEKERGVALSPREVDEAISGAVGWGPSSGFMKLTDEKRMQVVRALALELLCELEPHLHRLEMLTPLTVEELRLNGTVERVRSLLQTAGRTPGGLTK